MKQPLYLSIKTEYANKGLSSVFTEVLGWDAATHQKISVTHKGTSYQGSVVATLLNVAGIVSFSTSNSLHMNIQKALCAEVGKRFPEQIVIFESKSISTWYWPKKTASGSQTTERIDVQTGALPSFLAQRLSGLQFSMQEHLNGLSAGDLKNRIRGSFDTTKITKKFYEGFRQRHAALAKQIKGLSAEECGSYASLLLNRLMFIYFLQKKEFLNSDTNYLRNCMKSLQAKQGHNHFYNFYKDLLLELFFNGLNLETQTYKNDEITKIIGKVPYINGGIFQETATERNNQIEIPDIVFEEIFDFFDSFTWHLDTRPTGNSDEINPEVLGFIFEQYINFTTNGKKENGAYYTKQDVTGYMVSNTLVPKVLDILETSRLDPLEFLKLKPLRYINESQMHGWDFKSNSWQNTPSDLQKIWAEDPKGWSKLDESALDLEICLPGESWVEMFARREKVTEILNYVKEASYLTTDDIISLNLNGQLLATDTIDGLADDSILSEIWQKVTEISVIDPTCGSGAFLFSALEILEDIYSHLVDAAQNIDGTWARDFIAKTKTHGNRRYFIRKQAALNNLFGTDLMQDAIETAKLRIFLALAACLETVQEIEPLPDLDFNLKTGNLILGLKDEKGFEGDEDNQIFNDLEGTGLRARINQYKAFYKAFLEASTESSGSLQSLKDVLYETGKQLRDDANQLFWRESEIDKNAFHGYLLEKRPFHWFVEFPQIMSRGGFDVIVGNPPYVRTKKVDRTDYISYKTFVCPDLYAACYERAISLLSSNGRMAFIVPVNLAFSDDFKILREIIQSKFAQNWWSTFDQLPQGLFEGAAIRNTIVVSTKTGKKQNHSSLHNIFTVATRSWLFDSLQYFPVELENIDSPVPRAGLVTKLIEDILKSERDLGRIYESDICLKSTANYWVPISPIRPPVLDSEFKPTDHIDTELHELKLGSFEDENVVIAALSGKLGFILWQAIGDGMHVLSSQMLHLRKAVPPEAHKSLKDKSQKVLLAGLDNTVVNLYRGKNFVSIRWAGIRAVSDEFDSALLTLMNFGDQWRRLNVAYRQLMKANDSRQTGQDTIRNRNLWNLPL